MAQAHRICRRLFMPYVSQTRHIDRVRNVIEGRMSSPGADASRLASSYRRSLEQYHLDPGATIGPRILTVPELRDVQQREETVLRASGECLSRSEEHTSELQSLRHLVCRPLLEKKKKYN